MQPTAPSYAPVRSSPAWLIPPVLHRAPLEMVLPPAPPPEPESPKPHRGHSLIAMTLERGPVHHFITTGKRASSAEYKAMREQIEDHPELRIRIGQPHPERDNCYFMGYSMRCPNAERWGTKQQLVDHRKSKMKATRKWKKEKMKTDPVFKAKQLASLAAFTARDKAVQEEKSEHKEKRRLSAIKRAKKSRAKRKAKAAKKGAKA